jgi:predicted ATPase
VRWAVARCLSYDAAAPYQLAAKIVRSLLDIPHDSSEGHLALVLNQRIASLVIEDFDEVCPFLAHLLGAHLDVDQLARVRYLDGRALQTRYLTALRLLIAGLAARGPLVLLVDDAHWADASSVELLSLLLPLQGEIPVAFAFLTRPERDAPGWQLVTQSRELPGSGAVELHLAPLGENDSRQLVDNLLNAPGLPPALAHLVLTKSEGNPFFVEEVLRMLIDRGSLTRKEGVWVPADELHELEIPDTVQGVIATRIDRLPDEAKRVLQIAAVIGRRFPVDVLDKVLEGLDED